MGAVVGGGDWGWFGLLGQKTRLVGWKQQTFVFVSWLLPAADFAQFAASFTARNQ